MQGAPILVVDDNAANLKLITFLLRGRGHEVRSATDANAALEVLRTFTPRLILMDLQLPGMDGLTLTRTLRTQANMADVVILAVTAYAMKGDRERALEAGCDGYITKPIDTRTLPDVVQEHLAAGRKAIP